MIIAIIEPAGVAFQIHHEVMLFQINIDKKEKLKKTQGLFPCFSNSFSTHKRGMNATKRKSPVVFSHGRLNNIPESTESKKAKRLFIMFKYYAIQKMTTPLISKEWI